MAADATPLAPDDLRAARSAAETFLDAVVRGDEAAARSLLIVREGESVDFGAMHDSTAGYELGEPTAEAGAVVVVATIRAASGKDAPPALPLVLVRPEAAWRVDMGASIHRLLGVDLEGLVKQMAEGLGSAMGKAMEGVAEALSPPPAPPGDPAAKRPRRRPSR